MWMYPIVKYFLSLSKALLYVLLDATCANRLNCLFFKEKTRINAFQIA